MQWLLTFAIFLLLGFLGLAVADVYGWKFHVPFLGPTRAGLNAIWREEQTTHHIRVTPLGAPASAYSTALPYPSEAIVQEPVIFEKFVPTFPWIPLAVHDSAAYQDPGEAGHEAWFQMFPQGNGLVKVSQPRRYGLPQSQPWRAKYGGKKWGTSEDGYDEEAEVFEVAVVRELECLLRVRAVISDMFEDRSIVNGMEARSEVWRCLDHCELLFRLTSLIHVMLVTDTYAALSVRQAILCHADTTLERVGKKQADMGSARKHSPAGSPGSAAEDVPIPDLDASVGSVRQCKNWDKIKEWLETHRADQD
jgi:hypothetical protein